MVHSDDPGRVVLYSHSAANILALTTTTHVNVHLLGAALDSSVSFMMKLTTFHGTGEIPAVE